VCRKSYLGHLNDSVNFAEKMTGMKLNDRIESFVFLGKFLQEFLEAESRREDPAFSDLDMAIRNAGEINSWFTQESVLHVLRVWASCLVTDDLQKWMAAYSPRLTGEGLQKNVAVIMAGNIPLVGFHDFLSVLLSGNNFLGRLSSDDTELLPAVACILVQHNPEWEKKITFTKERISGFEAVIATGSDNSARYFNYYFSKVPHIIRKNRNGIAILAGDESAEELSGLADDILLYFGLGCRNVSKLYVPEKYDISDLFRAFTGYAGYVSHNKWMNNYDYYRSVFLLNQIPALDNGFVLLTENAAIASPPAVVYYEKYSDTDDLMSRLLNRNEEIQVAVCRKEIPLLSCLPGQAQSPGLTDYADGIDTMEFLLSLSK
jgi:hypothetical protein